MSTNLALDDSLINKVQKIGGFKTKKEAVTNALQEYVNRQQQLKILDIFGKVDMDPSYNYKNHRSRK